MSTRLTGQDCLVSVFVDQKVIAELDHVKEISISFEMAVSLEDYIGGKGRRPDGKFDNLKCEMTCHSQGPAWVDFVAAAVAYSRRDAGAPTSFDLSVTMNYPTGEQRAIVLKRLEFETMDFTLGGRKDMVEVKVPVIPDDFEFVT